MQNTTIKAGEVVALKPLQGSDIIGRLTADFQSDHPFVSVRKPLEAHVVQGQNGGLGLAFSPFSLSARDDQVFLIPRDQLIVEPFLARDEVKKTYTEQTSSLTLL